MVVAELFAKLGLVPDKKSWEKGHDLIQGMHTALAAFVGFKAFQSIAGWVHDTVEAGDAAVKTAQKLGITSDAVQELGYAAGQSGTSGEALTGALGKLAKGMDEVAKTGKGPVAEAFSALGIGMGELKGETLDQNLELISAKFAAMPDGVKKTALAMKLFGKSGAELIPLLNSGQEGIVELRNEAHELGYVIEEDSAKQMEAFGDNVDRVKTVLIGMRNQAISALMPALQSMVGNILAWVKANKEVIKNTITGAVKVAIVVVKGLGEAIKVVGGILSWFAEHGDTARAVLMALGAMIAYTAAAAIGAWVAAAAAFALPVAAIAALILILQDVWESITTGRGITALVVKFIGDQFGKLGKYIASIPRKIGDAFRGIGNRIKQAFGDAWEWIKRKADGVWQDIKNVFGGSLGDLTKNLPRAGGAKAPIPTAGGPTAFNEPRRTGVGAPVSNTYGDIHITTSPGTDNVAFAEIVRKQIDTHWGDRMDEALAGTGTA